MNNTTFEEWVKQNVTKPEKDWTFRDYANYVTGWRNSLPWAYKGMGVAYDQWAEKQLEKHKIEDLRLAWKYGLAVKAKYQTTYKSVSVEDAADMILYSYF